MTENKGGFNIGIFVTLVVGSVMNKCTVIQESNEYILARMFKIALRNEDYKQCDRIKKEIDNRISKGTIDHGTMEVFRDFDETKKVFFGDYDFSGLNGLFDNYKCEKK